MRGVGPGVPGPAAGGPGARGLSQITEGQAGGSHSGAAAGGPGRAAGLVRAAWLHGDAERL